MRSSKKRSSKSTLPIRPIRQSSSTGVLTDTLDRIEIVDNSKKNRKAYEEDLSEMMRLSSTRRFKWESTLQFFVAGVSYLIGYDSSFAFIQTFDKAGIAMIIPFWLCWFVMRFLFFTWKWLLTVFFFGPSMLFRRLCPAMSAIGYMSWAVALVGMVSNQAVIMVCLDLLMSSVSTVWNGEIHFAHCHHYYNTEDCIDPE
uniref:Uncharacterized protein n=1 Tax=Ditylenchus dipsaci TaxID=166011 RepID=A0A915D907_9BILA